MYTMHDLYDDVRKVHGDEYGYNLLSFTGKKNKMDVYCNIHGLFRQTPEVHLMGCGCPECGKEKSIKKRTLTKEQLEARGRELYGDFYIYDNVVIKNAREKVKIICPIHGEFWQTPDAHMHGHKCPECSKCKRRDTQSFIKECDLIHGNKYDYSKVVYKNRETAVCIICPEHGEFLQTPKSHLSGCGCPKCANNVKLSTEEFIERCHRVWGDLYDYSKVNYVRSIDEVEIICKKHGTFFQTANSHLSGHGCPHCANEEYLEEKRLYEYVIANLDDTAERGYHFDFLNRQHIDVYSPKYNVGIEYQGVEHFEPVERFGGVDKYNLTIERDERKYRLCMDNGIKLFYFSKEKKIPKAYFSHIYTNYNELITAIINEHR